MEGFAALHEPEKLIMVGTRNNRLETAKKLGATHTININESDPYEAIMELTGKGYAIDLITPKTRDAYYKRRAVI